MAVLLTAGTLTSASTDGHLYYVSISRLDHRHLLAAIDPDVPGELAWQIDLPGFAGMHPILDSRGELYVGGGIHSASGGAVDAPDDGWVAAVDLETRSILWIVRTRDRVVHAALIDGVLYVQTADPILYFH